MTADERQFLLDNLEQMENEDQQAAVRPGSYAPAAPLQLSTMQLHLFLPRFLLQRLLPRGAQHRSAPPAAPPPAAAVPPAAPPPAAAATSSPASRTAAGSTASSELTTIMQESWSLLLPLPWRRTARETMSRTTVR